jgi:hypothetical protein
MPKPTLGEGYSFPSPPDELLKESWEDSRQALYDWMYLLHTQIYGPVGGKGNLNEDNIDGKLTDTISGDDHGTSSNVTKYQHHGSGQHSELVQAVASPNITDGSGAPTSVVTAGAAGNAQDPYDAERAQEVVDLANNLRPALIDLIEDVRLLQESFAGFASDYNILKNYLRDANLIST